LADEIERELWDTGESLKILRSANDTLRNLSFMWRELAEGAVNDFDSYAARMLSDK